MQYQYLVILLNMRPEPKTYVIQKINNGFTFGNTTWFRIATPFPSPSDLDLDASLNIEEKTGITDTAEAVQIDKIYIILPDIFEEYQTENNYLIKGWARLFIKLGVAGDGTNTCYLTKVAFSIGYVDWAGTFYTTITSYAVPNISESATTYKEFSTQCYTSSIPDTALTRYNNFACRIKVYGYVSAGTGGKIEIIHRRGETDTYINAFIAPVGV